MNKPNSTIRYFAYVRKSTEGEERQALSIESQKDKVWEVFPDLEIVDILEEKHSAFKPYNRPVFDEMIKRIRKGEATGIIAWHPDRLSRNEIDASTITYLVRTGVIHDLKFGSYNFDNSPEGIMMLQLALSQSQYFSSKLGKDVKRGLEKKVSLGWLPGVAPEGYLNDMRLEKGQRTIITDKKRAVLLRRAFDMFLTGAYSAQEVFNKLNNEWGYRTRKKKKMGGKPLSRSLWYKILNNPFYAGVIVYNGKESKGRQKPIITIDEFNRIQELLGGKGCMKKPGKRDFTFTGLFRCGVCGCLITAEHKTKYIKSQNKVKGYDYYHCTHKKKEIDCRQGSVLEEDIKHEILLKLKGIEIHPKFLEWGLEYLDSVKETENEKKKIIDTNQKFQTAELESQLSELTMMRAKKLIDDEGFIKESDKLKKQIKDLKKGEEKNDLEADIKFAKEKLSFCVFAFKRFIEGGKDAQKEILAQLGSNREIINKNVVITLNPWLIPIHENAEQFNAEMKRLEPALTLTNTTQKEALASLRSRWLGDLDSNQDKRLQRPLSCRWTIPEI